MYFLPCQSPLQKCPYTPIKYPSPSIPLKNLYLLVAELGEGDHKQLPLMGSRSYDLNLLPEQAFPQISKVGEMELNILQSAEPITYNPDYNL